MPEGSAAVEAGDILWIDFGKPVGHEQGGRRPAIVLTRHDYNVRSSVLLVCPISRKRRDWPFEVDLPPTGRLSGVILVDQIRVIDPVARPVGRAGTLSSDVFDDVKAKLAALLGIAVSF